MKLKKIVLKNYRNYDNLELELNDNLNIIIGDNAQGKTNILESIYVLGLTKSFLTINEKNAIKLDTQFTTIKGILDNKKKLEVLINIKGKKVKINDNEIKKLSEYISNLNIIVFSPDNIRMIKDGPHVRRKYLNIEISQVERHYLNILNNYNVLLRQKNEFFKIMNDKLDTHLQYLEIINNKYIDCAVDIYLYRKKYIDQINSKIGPILDKIMGKTNIYIKYISNVDYNEDREKMKQELKSKIDKNYIRELQYKMSLIGPHRDDFIFLLNDKNLALYGSQGQIRAVLLAFKLAEVEIFKEITNDQPILLLDDVFSELDITKKNKIIAFLDKDIQTIITTTDIESIEESLLERATVYLINNNKITQEGKR